MRKQHKKLRKNKQKYSHKVGVQAQLGEAVGISGAVSKSTGYQHELAEKPGGSSFSDQEVTMLRYIRRDVLYSTVMAAVMLGGLLYVGIAFGGSEEWQRLSEQLVRITGLIE